MKIAGRRVLVVEDEYLLAKKMADEFAKLGVETVGPVSSVERALHLVEHGGRLDGAVLDITVRGGMVFPVAEALRACDVPFVFATGYDERALPNRYSDVVSCQKPVDPAEVVRALFSKMRLL